MGTNSVLIDKNLHLLFSSEFYSIQYILAECVKQKNKIH